MSQSTDIRLGIAGSGAIAIGLAKAAGPHVDTVLRAHSEESAERVRSRLDDSVRVVADLGDLSDRSYVVEAIAEDHDVKVGLLAEINGHLGADAVLATTT
ncbi:MAG: 3-hydroxyacyl-CoA dehydrogenase NAD-binding domain-containing protein, partial [Thermoleophilaceae bacterium]